MAAGSQAAKRTNQSCAPAPVLILHSWRTRPGASTSCSPSSSWPSWQWPVQVTWTGRPSSSTRTLRMSSIAHRCNLEMLEFWMCHSGFSKLNLATRRSRSQLTECWWNRDQWRSFVSTRAGQNFPFLTDLIRVWLWEVEQAWKSAYFSFLGKQFKFNLLTLKSVQGHSQGIQVRLLERCGWNRVRLYGEKYKYKYKYIWKTNANKNLTETKHFCMVRETDSFPICLHW